jgi:hypothetical protein
MNTVNHFIPQLEKNLALYHQILTVIHQENQTLRQPDPPTLEGHRQARNNLLPALVQSLDQLKALRQSWHAISPADRAPYHEVGSLLRQSQDVVMRVIMMDRENEQCLLRRGLFPAREMPRLQSASPQFVAHRYRRQPRPLCDHAV